jgi:ribosomal protein S18 acetylase RimI-like enzyme
VDARVGQSPRFSYVSGIGDVPLELRRGEYLLTTDRAKIPLEQALALLHTTFWASDMSADQLRRAMRGSVCFGIVADNLLVAFARVVTDLATYAYLCDVVVDPAHGRKGLAQWMVKTMLEHPQMQGFRRFSLMTTTAKRLYEKFGFTDKPTTTYMELKNPSRLLP